MTCCQGAFLMRILLPASALLASALVTACQPAADLAVTEPGEAASGQETAAPASAPQEQAASSGLDAVFEPHLPWDSDAQAVQTTDSGLEYIVLSEGDADGASPTARDRVTVMYEGRLARTGEIFDSSYARGEPASFPLGGVIAGWTEGLQLMSVGDDYLFYIPADLAYGDNPRPGGIIRPGDDLVFRVELQDVEKAPEPRPTDDAAWDRYTPWDSSREGIKTTGSGLEYVVLEGVESGTSPRPEDQVVVFYEGRLDDTGEVFDSAFQRGAPAVFPAGRLIPGWVEALGLMKPGERWLIHVPSELAYGEEGTPGGPIPPNADLNFEIELVDVMPAE